MTIFDLFHSCKSVPNLIRFLAMAFQDFSEWPAHQWEFMAMFVLEIAADRVVFDATSVHSLKKKTND
jgi:hypothetical protein